MRLKLNFITLTLILISIVGCATSSVQESTLIATEGADTIEFTVPASKVKMTIPKNDLVKAENTASKSYRYFIYNGKSTDFSISGWFEPENKYEGVEKHWNGFLKKLDWKSAGKCHYL